MELKYQENRIDGPRDALYAHCTLCPRLCGADRLHGQKGACGMDAHLTAARAALHYWEEPCISGYREGESDCPGSGAVFFTGCNLGCVYCQNRELSAEQKGEKITPVHLAEIFLSLQAQGACNLNLVTGCHFVPGILDALDLARARGLTLPVVYNSSGYERVETLKLLEGYVDVYLPDFKYADPLRGEKYSHVKDYPERALAAIGEMLRQCPAAEFDAGGIMRKGVIIRHLVLPGAVKESQRVLRLLHETFGDAVYISIMSQYTPMGDGPAKFPELNRRITKREYEKVMDYALSIGIENAFIQDRTVAKESFIPAFDGSGMH